MPTYIGDILSAVVTLILMLAVFAGAYMVSKAVGNQYRRTGTNLSGNIKIVERVVLGKDKMLLIVKVCDKTLLMGITGQHIEKIEELDSSFFIDNNMVENNKLNIDFIDTFKQEIKKRMNKNGGDK